MFGEREAFEKAIDADPLEATNHLAYADWLEENGEPDEAAFRRSMGNWIQDPRTQMELKPLPPLHGVQYAHSVSYPFLPDWVFSGSKPIPGENQDRHAEFLMTADTPGATGAHPHVALHNSRYPWDNYRWRTYRGMEEAFRRAFMKNRYNKQYKRNYILPRRRFSRK